jgi:glutamine synthetase adenylyltransferase
VEKLAARKVMEGTDARGLRDAYNFLRTCESVLRRWQLRSVSTLPVTHEEEMRFARRMKFATIEDFRAPYGRARETIHSLRTRYLVE